MSPANIELTSTEQSVADRTAVPRSTPAKRTSRRAGQTLWDRARRVAARRRRADADEQLKREPIAEKCAAQMDALYS